VRNPNRQTPRGKKQRQHPYRADGSPKTRIRISKPGRCPSFLNTFLWLRAGD